MKCAWFFFRQLNFVQDVCSDRWCPCMLEEACISFFWDHGSFWLMVLHRLFFLNTFPPVQSSSQGGEEADCLIPRWLKLSVGHSRVWGDRDFLFGGSHNTELEELCKYCWPSKLIVLAHVSWIQLFKSEFSCKLCSITSIKREPAREEWIWEHTQVKHLRSGWCREKTKVGKVTKNLARNFIRWAYLNIIGTSRFVCVLIAWQLKRYTTHHFTMTSATLFIITGGF
jgi:hypothetical protein